MPKLSSYFNAEPREINVELGRRLPKSTSLYFAGERNCVPLLRGIAFRKGVVALNYKTENDSGNHITGREASILGMSSIGFDREQTAQALGVSPQTIATLSKNLYSHFNVSGSIHSSTLAIAEAFRTGFYKIKKPVRAQDISPTTETFINYFVNGYTIEQMAKDKGLTEDKVKNGIHAAYDETGLPDRNSLVFYAHLAGWLPLRESVEQPSPKEQPAE